MMKTLSSLLVVITLAVVGADRAGAHSQKHGDMKKQHREMSTINKQWQSLEQSFLKGNTEAAAASADRILKSASHLGGFMPHRNPDRHAQFLEYSTIFSEELTKLRDALQKKELETAKENFEKVRGMCVRCHEMFQ